MYLNINSSCMLKGLFTRTEIYVPRYQRPVQKTFIPAANSERGINVVQTDLRLELILTVCHAALRDMSRHKNHCSCK
jgi:hypothetical protein